MTTSQIVVSILVAILLGVSVRLAWHTTIGGQPKESWSASDIGKWILRFFLQVLINLIINILLELIINLIVNAFLQLITLGNADPVFVGGGGLAGGGGVSGGW